MVAQLATRTDHLLVYGRCSKRRGPVHEELTVRVAPLAHPQSARRSLAAGLVVVALLAIAGTALFGTRAHQPAATLAVR
jgi:hypothetical protein